MFKDYYKLLEITQNASDKEIKKAFKVQAIKWHPDKNLEIDTTLRMQEINEAYLILKDNEARARYDIEYNRFQQYQKEYEKTRSKKEEKQHHEQYEYKDYEVEDDLLAKWMANAKKQAVDLAKKTIQDFKGVTKAATHGCLEGIVQLIIWMFIINLIRLLISLLSK